MPVSVEGVLDSSAGGSQGRGKHWDLVFHLMPWHRLDTPDAELPTKPLRIEMPVTERALRRWMEKLPAGTAVRLAIDRPRMYPRHDLWWFGKAERGPAKVALSARLAEAVAARSRKIVVKDVTFGKLTLDRRLSWYAGRVSQTAACSFATW
jgi:hypothetical protein